MNSNTLTPTHAGPGLFACDMGARWAEELGTQILELAPELMKLGSDAYTNGYGGADDLTGRWRQYNLLRRSPAMADARQAVLGCVLAAADEFGLRTGDRSSVVGRAWANVWDQGLGIAPHCHYSWNTGEEQRRNKLAGNVFVGGDVATSTDYLIDGVWVSIPNVAGRITVFDARLIHRVLPHAGSQRISVGMNLRTTPDFADDETPDCYEVLAGVG